MAKVKRIDHIAVVIDDMQGTLEFWRDALGMEVTHIQDIPAEMAQIAFLPAGGSEIELVRPTTSRFRAGKIPGKTRPGHAPRLPGGR